MSDDPIPATAGLTEFTPLLWPDGSKAPCFILTVPTGLERDGLHSRLIRMGLNAPSLELIRATFIDELFNIDWGQGEEGNVAYAEQEANFLDGYWSNVANHNLALDMWQQQEVQRMLDEATGAPKRDVTRMPESPVSKRDISHEAVLSDELVVRSLRLRDLLARQNDYSRQEGLLLVRIHLIEARGLADLGSDPWQPRRDPRLNVMIEDDLVALREQMPDRAWTELIARVKSLYTLSETERKNSDSPSGNSSTPTSSSAPSDDQASSDGARTDSSISQAPGAGSGPITGKRSGRRRGVAPVEGSGAA